MNRLFDRILALNSESGWRPEDVEKPDGGRIVFDRFAGELLTLLKEEMPGISSACMSLAGIECGFLVPVATWPPEAKGQAKKIPRDRADVLHSESNKGRVLIATPAGLHPTLSPSDYRPGRHLTVKLVGYGEYYGLVWLDASDDKTFTPEAVKQIEAVLPALLRVAAEANFSMRLQRLAEPLESPNGRAPTRDEIYTHIARQAALGLAADGAVLRIQDRNSTRLLIKGVFGDAGVASGQDLPIRERICKAVFDVEKGFGAAHNVLSGQSFGVPISDEDKKQLAESGLVSFMIMLLQSDVGSKTGSERLGTLSVIHHRPHDFSLRDIRLARMFAERVSDDLALLNQKDDLEEQTLMLNVQNNMITRAEVIALLAHDLGHKAIQITQRVEDFSRFCRKAIKEKWSADSIDSHTHDLAEACTRLQSEIHQIRRISYNPDEKAVAFDLGELIEEATSTIGQVLDRASMDVEMQIPGRLMLYGPRGILGQVLFNLLINSIDAQRAAPRQRRNVIHIHCRRDAQGERHRVVIHFSDDGPGISFHHFPRLEDIFQIGSTSKEEGQGTGTGLPVSRSLLDKYFRGTLEIRERRPPLFEITVPLTHEAKSKD